MSSILGIYIDILYKIKYFIVIIIIIINYYFILFNGTVFIAGILLLLPML